MHRGSVPLPFFLIFILYFLFPFIANRVDRVRVGNGAQFGSSWGIPRRTLSNRCMIYDTSDDEAGL